MILQRITVHYKDGMLQEAVRLLKEGVVVKNELRLARFFVPKDVPNTTVGYFEFENERDIATFWDNWAASPETLEFRRMYEPLVVPEMLFEVLYPA